MDYLRPSILKQVISIALVLVFLLPNCSKVWVLIDFKINQDFIAEVLCINKEKTITICNGRCYLAEQLQKQEEHEEQQAPQQEKVETLFVEAFFNNTTTCWIPVKKPSDLDHYTFFYTANHLDRIFKPPQFS